MKKFILLLIVPFVMSGQKLSDHEINEFMTAMALETASICPVQMDKYTMVANCIYSHNQRTMMYSVVCDIRSAFSDDVVGIETGTYTMEQWEGLWLIEQKNIMANMFCTTPETKILRDNKIQLTYRYSDPNGKYIGKIELQKSVCK